MNVGLQGAHLMRDFPTLICRCISRADSLRPHLFHIASSERAARIEKAAIASNPIRPSMRLTILRTSFKIDL
jgi:hypothetical protein